MVDRESKFRGKRKDNTLHNGSWVYGHYFTTPLTEENSGLASEFGWHLLSDGKTRHCISQDGVVYVVDEETVDESSGLKDINGKDIYTRDIVRLRNTAGFHGLARVEFNDGCYEVVFKDRLYVPATGEHKSRDYLKVFVERKACEVLSNTLDRPLMAEE